MLSRAAAWFLIGVMAAGRSASGTAPANRLMVNRRRHRFGIAHASSMPRVHQHVAQAGACPAQSAANAVARPTVTSSASGQLFGADADGPMLLMFWAETHGGLVTGSGSNHPPGGSSGLIFLLSSMVIAAPRATRAKQMTP